MKLTKNNPEMIVIEIENKSIDAPYSSYFIVQEKWVISSIPEI